MSDEAVPVPPNWHKFDSCGICACGVKWTSIMNVDVDDGWPEKTGDAANDGFAHIGNRTPQEARYVAWLRERQQAAIAEATGWLPVVREQLPTDQVTFCQETQVNAIREHWHVMWERTALSPIERAQVESYLQQTPYYAELQQSPATQMSGPGQTACNQVAHDPHGVQLCGMTNHTASVMQRLRQPEDPQVAVSNPDRCTFAPGTIWGRALRGSLKIIA